jgi:hypothetical protein
MRLYIFISLNSINQLVFVMQTGWGFFAVGNEFLNINLYPSRFSIVFFSPRANAELVPKYYVSLHASHAALPPLTPKFRPKAAPPPC